MADSRPFKRIKNSEDEESSLQTTTCVLPPEILVDIASKVASQSLADLYHLKLTSKEMMNLTNDDHIYKHASLDKVPFLECHQELPQEALFLSRCRSSGNLEALYRESMKACFRGLEHTGLAMLRVLAQKGHQRSKYAFAMIVLIMCTSETTRMGFSRTPEEFEEALGHLRCLRNHKCVLKCRNDVADFVGLLRWEMRCDHVVMTPRARLCNNVPCTNTWRLRIGSWCFMTEEDDENDPNMCENCRWDHEVEEFCKMI